MARKTELKSAAKRERTFDGSDPDLDYRPGGRDDPPESRTVAARQRLRRKLDHDVEAYLAGGGAIEMVDAHVTATAAGKPSGSYGGRPI